MRAEKTLALETLNLLRDAELAGERLQLKAASTTAYTLGPLREVDQTPRFETSFAIECLIRSIDYREEQVLIERRHEFALLRATRWLESES